MKKLILLISVVLLVASCGEKFLEQYPSTSITSDNAIQTKNDVEYAVNGMYDLMASQGYYGAAMFFYGDVKGDDVQSLYSNSRHAYYCYMYEHIPSSLRAGYLWGRPWYVIRQASNILQAVNDNKVKDASQAELSDFVGQAIAARALAHFDLTRCFGYPYAKDKGASWGVPIIDHPLGFDENPIRNTVAECYDFIIAELQKAIPMLSTSKNDGRINQYAARALLARVYLYCEKNAEAYQAASSLIEELKSTQYKLATNANYISQFDLNNKFGSESLFEIANLTTDNPSWNALSYLYHWWGYADMVATREFYDLMASDPDDVRGKLLGKVTQNGINKWWLMKYPGPAYRTPATENNYMVLRLSEVYLIAAEAGVKSGSNKAKALEYLNAISMRANPDDVVTMDQFTLDRVLLERRKELIGEGHRFFDMIRNGRTIYRKGGYHLANVPQEIDWNYYKVVLPIPAEQFKINSDMQQNPEYSRE